MKWILLGALALGALLAGPLLVLLNGEASLDRDWRNASRRSAGIAPEPQAHPAALVQVYAARAFGWRGAFAVHTWIATKPEGAREYTVHEVMGWHVRHGGEAVVSRPGTPDRYWFGQPPRLLSELRGPSAGRAIARIEQLVRDYPYAGRYVMWPGPNSNTFTAHIARQVPELRLRLPTTAIGKDYLVESALLADSPAGDGRQLSLWGLLGVTLARSEVEFNLLGLSFGMSFEPFALKVPGKGEVALGL